MNAPTIKILPLVITGFGDYHTNDADPAKPNRKLTPYAPIDLAGIRALVDTPQNVDKSAAQWMIPSSLHSRKKTEQKTNGAFLYLWADIDQAEGEGDNKVEFYIDDPRHKSIDQIQGALDFEILEGMDFELYASKSAKENRHKCRIVIPLDKPLVGCDWTLCQEVLNAKLLAAGIVPDPANLSCNQIMYLPNRGEFYATASVRLGNFFDPLDYWSDDIERAKQTLTVKTAAVEKRKAEALERRQSLRYDPSTNPIDAFNEAYSIEEILIQHGYDQRGDSFKHPDSETGGYSATVRDGRVHTFSPADPLYTGGGGGGAHSAFSAFCILKHGDIKNINKAIKDACDNLLFVDSGLSWNKAKQRAYKKATARAEAVADMKPIDQETGEEEEAPEPELRSYEEILADAEKMTAETPPGDIQKIASECRELDPIECRRVFMALKRGTGMPLGTLTAAMKSGNEGEDEPDHLQLATEVIRQIGPDNIFATQSFVWHWSGSGVWGQSEDRAVKQLVQNAIPGHTPEVFKSLVDGVSDVLKTEVYRANHEFNIGPVETVNCPNGEVSLGTTWELHPHVKEHYRTTQIPISYDPTAKAPRFEKFLIEIFKGDADANEKREAILQMMGYTLMAHCRHEKFIVLLGCGANGKSVLLSVLEALVGSKNVAGVQPHQFDNVFQRGHLHCKLANIVSEVRQGEVVNDAALKGIVSGELTTVEHKHLAPFEMRPFATCWFGTNHMPHTRDDSDGFFRRALVVSFNNVFKPELGNADPHLKDKLMEELPGILNLALEAYDIAINISGFTIPGSSVKANADWRLESDQVAQFVDEACELKDASETTSQLYKAYRQWAGSSGIQKTVTKKTFSQRLELLGVGKGRTAAGRFFTGIYCKSARLFFNEDDE